MELFLALYKPWLPAIDCVVVNKYTFAANGRSAKRLGWLRMGGSTGDSGGTGHSERSFSGVVYLGVELLMNLGRMST